MPRIDSQRRWISLLSKAGRPGRRRAALRPSPETLEDRAVPSTLMLTVTDTGDSASDPKSLRGAIAVANKDHAHSYLITFGVSGTITLQSAGLELSNNISLQGPGSAGLTIAPKTGALLPGFRIFRVDANEVASISGMTLTGGSSATGGAILNNGTLTVSGDTVITGNSATSGGGIGNTGTLTVSGGAVISGNSAISGGGVYNAAGASATVDDGTITANTATGGGGVYNAGTMTITDGAQHFLEFRQEQRRRDRQRRDDGLQLLQRAGIELGSFRRRGLRRTRVHGGGRCRRRLVQSRRRQRRRHREPRDADGLRRDLVHV